MTSVSWCERFGAFTDWLQENGLATDYLPAWPRRTKIRVIAIPGTFFLACVGWREYLAYKRLGAARKMKLSTMPVKHMGTMHAVTVTEVDFEKFQKSKGRG